MDPKEIVQCRGRTITFNLCDRLKKHPRVILLLAEPGIGKTTYLNEYQSKNSGVYLCTIGRSFKPVHILTTLLKIINPKVNLVDPSTYNVMRELVETINCFKRHPLIIFDEAGKIKPAGFSLMQELFDETKGRASYVIAGPPYVDRNIQRAIRKDINGMQEFRRRINDMLELPYPNPSELAALLPQFGITDRDWIESKCGSCRTFDMLLNEIDSYMIEQEAQLNGYKPLKVSDRR